MRKCITKTFCFFISVYKDSKIIVNKPIIHSFSYNLYTVQYRCCYSYLIIGSIIHITELVHSDYHQ